MSNLRTITEAARELKVRRETVGDLLVAYQIPTYRVGLNRLAKGIDGKGFARLKAILQPEPPVPSRSQKKRLAAQSA